jgi:hypothetical protein
MFCARFPNLESKGTSKELYLNRSSHALPYMTDVMDAQTNGQFGQARTFNIYEIPSILQESEYDVIN